MTNIPADSINVSAVTEEENFRPQDALAWFTLQFPFSPKEKSIPQHANTSEKVTNQPTGDALTNAEREEEFGIELNLEEVPYVSSPYNAAVGSKSEGQEHPTPPGSRVFLSPKPEEMNNEYNNFNFSCQTKTVDDPEEEDRENVPQESTLDETDFSFEEKTTLLTYISTEMTESQASESVVEHLRFSSPIKTLGDAKTTKSKLEAKYDNRLKTSNEDHGKKLETFQKQFSAELSHYYDKIQELIEKNKSREASLKDKTKEFEDISEECNDTEFTFSTLKNSLSCMTKAKDEEKDNFLQQISKMEAETKEIMTKHKQEVSALEERASSNERIISELSSKVVAAEVVIENFKKSTAELEAKYCALQTLVDDSWASTETSQNMNESFENGKISLEESLKEKTKEIEFLSKDNEALNLRYSNIENLLSDVTKTSDNEKKRLLQEMSKMEAESQEKQNKYEQIVCALEEKVESSDSEIAALHSKLVDAEAVIENLRDLTSKLEAKDSELNKVLLDRVAKTEEYQAICETEKALKKMPMMEAESQEKSKSHEKIVCALEEKVESSERKIAELHSKLVDAEVVIENLRESTSKLEAKESVFKKAQQDGVAETEELFQKYQAICESEKALKMAHAEQENSVTTKTNALRETESAVADMKLNRINNVKMLWQMNRKLSTSNEKLKTKYQLQRYANRELLQQVSELGAAFRHSSRQLKQSGRACTELKQFIGNVEAELKEKVSKEASMNTIMTKKELDDVQYDILLLLLLLLTNFLALILYQY